MVHPLLFLSSTIILFLQCAFFKIHFDIDKKFMAQVINGVQIMQRWIEQESDTSTKYFLPCQNCGYELAVIKDDRYCLQSDVYKLLHPDTILRDKFIFRDYGDGDLARQIIRKEMFDSQPNFIQSTSFNPSDFINLSIHTTILYPYAKNLFRTHQLGKHVGCLFQKYFHIPGQEELALKSLHSLNYNNYQEHLKKQNKTQQCLKEAQFQTESFRMWEKKDCESFFAIINSDEYKRKLFEKGLQYIYKTNKHLGKGIMLLDSENEQLVRKQYNDGQFCGSNNQNVIIQKYVQNPLLYKGHKLEFRSYFQISSTNPPLLFGYRNALIKQCALKFDLMDFSFESHVCNTAVTQTHKVSINQNTTEYYIDWNLEGLQSLLIEEGYISSLNWLNEYLYPEMQKKLYHLYNSASKFLFSDSRVGEFFGIDFILDQDLQLWIFECNRNPNFLAVTEGRFQKFNKLIPDMLEIQLQLVQNRYRRVKLFLFNVLIPALKSQEFHVRSELLKHQFLIEFQDKFQYRQENTDNLAVFLSGDLIMSECEK